jgi:hypothetical protein
MIERPKTIHCAGATPSPFEHGNRITSVIIHKAGGPPPQKSPALVTFGCRPNRNWSGSAEFYDGEEGQTYMRYQQAYARRQRAVTFTRSSMRTVTIPLNPVDFERLERLAAKHNIGNATLGREIIRKYLKRHERA